MPDTPRSALPTTMRAIQLDAFGGIERLHPTEIPVPVPGAGQVLVELCAAGVGPWDALVREGKSGLGQLLPVTPGSDGSGTVVALGEGVTAWRPGDLVFGATNDRFTGGYAEFALFDAHRIALKPPGVGFLEAGGIPVVGVTAWSMLFEHGGLARGQRVLVHGAAGAVGSLCVQLARRAGARVIALCRTADLPFVATLGADEIVDVTVTDFTAAVNDVDLVIDTIGGKSQRKSFDVLKPGGILVSVVSPPDETLAAARGVRVRYFIVDVRRAVLEEIAQLMAAGDLLLNVGEVLSLNDAPVAHAMLAGRPHRRGKIVLDIRATPERDGHARIVQPLPRTCNSLTT